MPTNMTVRYEAIAHGFFNSKPPRDTEAEEQWRRDVESVARELAAEHRGFDLDSFYRDAGLTDPIP